MKRRPQSAFRFSTEPDPKWCAKALCRAVRLKRPTHEVTVGGLTVRLCASCARQWASVPSATVRELAP